MLPSRVGQRSRRLLAQAWKQGAEVERTLLQGSRHRRKGEEGGAGRRTTWKLISYIYQRGFRNIDLALRRD